MLDGEFMDLLGNFSTNTSVPNMFELIIAPFTVTMGEPLFYTVLVATTMMMVYFKTKNIALIVMVLMLFTSIWISTFIPEQMSIMLIIMGLIVTVILYKIFNKKTR